MSIERTTPEALLAHAGFVSGLAESLVFGHESADDVSQGTFTYALAHPPTEGPGLRAWMAKVARNVLRQDRRSRMRRDRREQVVARPEALSGPGLDREHARHRVVDAVERLDEPYRSAIVLRYLDDVPPREIAERQAVPVETVRTRIKRALSKLRDDLDRQHDGDQRAWCAALLPLTLTGRSAGTAAAGVAVMGSKSVGIVIAVLLLLLAAGGAWWFGGSGPDSAPERPDVLPKTGTQRAAEPPAVDPVPEQADGDVEKPAFALRFTDGAGNDLDAQDVVARYRAAGMPLVAQVVDETAITGGDASSYFRIIFGPTQAWRREVPLKIGGGGISLETPPKPGRYRLFLGRPGAAPMLSGVITVTDDGRADLSVPLPGDPVSHEVRFTDAESGEPLADATVTPVYEYGDDRAFLPGPALRTDADGRVTLALIEDEVRGRNRQPTWWVESGDRLRSVSSYEVKGGPPGETRTFPVHRAASVEGKAYRPDGQPAAGLEVVWTSKGRVARTTVAEDGSFRLAGIAFGGRPTAKVTVAVLLDPDAGQFAGSEVEVRSGETSKIDIGSPAAGQATAIVSLKVTAGGEPVKGVYLVVELKDGKGDRRFAQTDAKGVCRLEDVPAGMAEVKMFFGDVRVSDDHRADHQGDVELEAAEERSFEFTLPEGAILVTLVDDETGEPVVGGVAYASPADREAGADRFPGFRYSPGWSGFSGEDGKVLLRALLPGEKHALEAGGDGYEKVEIEGQVAGRADAPAEVTIRLKKK